MHEAGNGEHHERLTQPIGSPQDSRTTPAQHGPTVLAAHRTRDRDPITAVIGEDAMTRTIEIKHVEPKAQVRQLIDGLIDRLEGRMQHYRKDALSVHVLFEENGSRTVSRTAITCHIPGHVVAAREEDRVPGTAIRKAFSELERQLDKQNGKAFDKHHRLRRNQRAPEAEVSEF